MTEGKTFFGHPRGLATLFFTEMWERFSYYGMRAILILFMTTPAAQQGLGLDNETSGPIYGLYTASVYLLTLPGGWLADNIFGQRKAIWYGGILIMMGHLILAIPGTVGVFATGLAFVACGTGLLKPNISTMVGELYPEGGARRDAGFSVFYMGINSGSILGQFFVPLVGEKINWHWGFGLAAIGMFFGLLQYRLSQKTLLDIGIKPGAKVRAKEREDQGLSVTGNKPMAIGLVIVLIAFLMVLQKLDLIDITTAGGIATSAGILIVSITLFYFLYIIIAGGLTGDEKRKVGIIFFLFIGAALFWAGFEQAGSTLNLFARDYTNRWLFGWELPAGWMQNVNPIMIVIFAPIIGALWVKLAAKNLNPSTPLKFGFGLILMGLGFLVMYFAAHVVVQGMQAGMAWLVFTYFLHSAGELSLSPVGLSATTKLAPKAFVGQMMGIWFVATSVGNLIAGMFAGEFNPNDVSGMPSLFLSVVLFGCGSGILFVVFSPLMKKWMGNVT